MSQKSKLNVEPIEELEKADSTEAYIKDLEAEIDKYKAQYIGIFDRCNELKIELKEAKEIKIDVDYKIKYYQLLKTFHTSLEEFLPF